MPKKIIIIFVIILILAAGIVGGYFFVSSRNKNNQSLKTMPEKAGQEGGIVAGDLDYNDASGFYFSYPKSIEVNDVTPDDEIYYSRLNLSKEGEKLVISIYDTDAKTPDEFINSDFAYKGAALSGAVSLAGVSAKQYATSTKLLTVAIDSGVVYLIDGPKGGSFWEETQNVVTASFGFGTKNGSKDSAGDSGIIYEEEEVVE